MLVIRSQHGLDTLGYYYVLLRINITQILHMAPLDV